MHVPNRRNFLRFLAGSPLIAEALAQQPAVKDVLSVMDFEELARPKLPAAHWGYIATGVDDDLTLKANTAAYRKIQLRPRRMVDVSTVDTRTEILGTTWESPIFLCPVGGHRMFHPDGELGTARAAKATNTLQILSTQTSTAVEEVAKARGTPPWYQLYLPAKWQDAEKLVKRVEAAGCPVLVWTIDNLAGRNVETAERFRRMDTRDCTACHTNSRGGRLNAPMFAGLSTTEINPLTATWDLIGRLKKITSMTVMIKGIETREDAASRANRERMESSSRITAGAPRRICAPPSKRFPRLWTQWAARFPC